MKNNFKNILKDKNIYNATKYKLSYVIIQDKIFEPNQTCDLIFKKILK